MGWKGKIHNEKIKVSLKEDVDYSMDARRKDGHTDGLNDGMTRKGHS